MIHRFLLALLCVSLLFLQTARCSEPSPEDRARAALALASADEVKLLDHFTYTSAELQSTFTDVTAAKLLLADLRDAANQQPSLALKARIVADVASLEALLVTNQAPTFASGVTYTYGDSQAVYAADASATANRGGVLGFGVVGQGKLLGRVRAAVKALLGR